MVARDDFEFALQGTPNDANLLFNVGRCYDRLGNPVKARLVASWRDYPYCGSLVYAL